MGFCTGGLQDVQPTAASYLDAAENCHKTLSVFDIAPHHKANSDEEKDAASLMIWKCKFGVSDAATQSLLEYVLPSPLRMEKWWKPTSNQDRRRWLREGKQLIESTSNLGYVDSYCCTTRCMAFTGPSKRSQSCGYCGKSRYNAAGKPRKSFHYLPFIPSLVAGFQNKDFRKGF